MHGLVGGEYLAFEGPPARYVANADAGVYAMGTPPTKAAVNALHVQRYEGGGWSGPRATGTAAAAALTTVANGLAEAQMTRVMAKILMPKYSGQRTRNKYVNESTLGCSEGQRQRFCMSMLPHCVPTNVRRELDNLVEDGKISTWDEMWLAFGKKEVVDLSHHAQGRFKAVSLKTLGGQIRVAD